MSGEVRIEQLSANDGSVRLVHWLVAHGAQVTAGEPLVEVETAKVTVAVESPYDGFVAHLAAEQDILAVGDVVAMVCADPAELAQVERKDRPPTRPAGDTSTRFSASAARYVEEHGIPRNAFAGYRLVSLVDAQEVHARRRADAPDDRGKSPVPLSRSKALEIERLTGANVLNAALSMQFDGTKLRREAQTAALPATRLLARVVNAVARTLVSFPNLNSYFDGGIRRYPTIDVDVAIDLGDGLKVGGVRHADTLGVAAIEDRIVELATRYIAGALTLADVAGGGVTVSDLSMEGVLFFQPLLNQRQALALGLGGDESLPGAPLTLTATFDHRVSSGREVSQFLRTCREALTAAPS